MTSTKSLEVGMRHGFRSGLEESNTDRLIALGVPYAYEQFKVPWDIRKSCTYTPDFLLPNGIIIETKGRFVTADRQKHLAVQEQEPDLDIRFVFSRSKARLSKGSPTTYGKWCETKGFLYADVVIPRTWIDEPANELSLTRVRQLFALNKKNSQCPF